MIWKVFQEMIDNTWHITLNRLIEYGSHRKSRDKQQTVPGAYGRVKIDKLLQNDYSAWPIIPKGVASFLSQNI